MPCQLLRSKFQELLQTVLVGGFCLTTTLSSANTIAFFYALDQDLSAMKTELGSQGQSMRLNGRSVTIINTKDLTVIASAMKPGPVETAVTAEALLSRFQCRLALSIGPTGGLDPKLKPGDWGAVTSVVPYQKTPNEKPDGSTMNEIHLPHNHHIKPKSGTDNSALSASGFPTLSQWSAASGEKFISSSSQRTELRRTTGAHVVEMNLFGLDAALKNHKTIGLHIRVVSDLADEDANADFLAFVKSYDGSGGTWCARFMKSLPPDPNSPLTYPKLRSLIEEGKETK